LFNNTIKAQKLDLSSFLTEKVSQNFKKVAVENLKSLGINDKEIEINSAKLHILKNGFQIVEYQYKGNIYDKLYIVIPKKDNSSGTVKATPLVFFTKDISKIETAVYDRNGRMLYIVKYDKKKKT